MSRLPNFIIIGAMKAGTTSLFRWLSGVSGVSMPSVKEPNFFCDEEAWARGPAWYGSLFPTDPALFTGEASVRYTHLTYADTAARRIASMIPTVRLIFLARDPLARMQSHYKHEVQRGREKRPLQEVLAKDGGGPYVETSLYSRTLAPYLERQADRLQIVDFEKLTGPDDDEWHRVLNFLGLPRASRPPEAHNVSAGREGFTPVMRWLYDRRFLPSGRRARLFPEALRKRVRPLLMRRSQAYSHLLASSECAVPDAIHRQLEQERLWIESARKTGHADIPR